jgi:hypothetical protein
LVNSLGVDFGRRLMPRSRLGRDFRRKPQAF